MYTLRCLLLPVGPPSARLGNSNTHSRSKLLRRYLGNMALSQFVSIAIARNPFRLGISYAEIYAEKRQDLNFIADNNHKFHQIRELC